MAGQSRSSGWAVERYGSPLGAAASGVGLKRVGPGGTIIKAGQEGRYVNRFVRSA
jgi:hypothetical protein